MGSDTEPKCARRGPSTPPTLLGVSIDQGRWIAEALRIMAVRVRPCGSHPSIWERLARKPDR